MLRSPLNLPSTLEDKNNHNGAQQRNVVYFGQDVYFHEYDDANGGGGRHLTSEQLEPYRLQGDAKMDALLNVLQKDGRPLQSHDNIIQLLDNAFVAKATTTDGDDDYDDPISNQALRQFHDYYSTLPSWVDIQQLERGQQVYWAYLPAISIALYYRSLVPGFAIPKIASVLLATRYLSPPSSRERVRARLMDTAAMVAVCMSTTIQHLR
jgi:hypothetical protein